MRRGRVVPAIASVKALVACAAPISLAAAGIAIVASLAPLPPRASANVFDVFWVPVAGQPGGTPYPVEATSGPGGDPQLLAMQTWDLRIYNNDGGDWSSAGMRLVLPAGNVFYQHSFGTNTKPSSLLTSVFPALAFDTYVTSPNDTGSSGAPAVTGGYPPGALPDFGGSSGVFSVSWSSTVTDPSGNHQIARITFPKSTFPAFAPFGQTTQMNPVLTKPIEPMDFPTTNRWLPDADGSWHDPANWSQGREPGANNIFPLLDVGGATVRTVTHSQGRTAVHGITSHEHILLSGGTISTINGFHIANGLTLDGGTLRGYVSGSAVQVGDGGGRLDQAILTAGIIHATHATLVVQEGLTLGGSSTINAGARLWFESPTRFLGGTGIVQHGGGVIDVAASGTLTIGGSLLIRKMAGPALRINGSFALVNTATIDVVDGALVTDYSGASPLEHVRAKVISGYDNGSWNGIGINSSTAANDSDLALGYAEASAIFASFPATFMGESIDATSVLVRLTRTGDANLDGRVDLSDFNRLAAGFGSTGALWDDGDFNYDGQVDLQDFNRMAANFGLAASGVDPTPDDWAALAAAVPEPALPGTLGIALLIAAEARSRRRRIPG